MKSIAWLETASCIRRWPWVTLGLIVTNLVLFMIVHHRDEQRELRLAERGVLALAYFRQHPYLTLKPPLNEFVEPNLVHSASKSDVTNLAGVGNLVLRAASNRSPDDGSVLQREQAELDAKVGAFAKIVNQWQSSSLGYVPLAKHWWSLISYQFMHGSWVHLLGNLCLLLLVGRKLEPVWGRTIFAVLYVSSGVVAAIAHHVTASDSIVPLIGASGAIAGLFGAFAFVALPRAVAARSVSLLARGARHWILVVLMLWFAIEMAQASLLPRREGSVSHFAHVGGFAFGLFFAWVLRACRLESRADVQAH